LISHRIAITIPITTITITTVAMVITPVLRRITSLILVLAVLDKEMTVLRLPWILHTMLGKEESVTITNQLIILIPMLPRITKIIIIT